MQVKLCDPCLSALCVPWCKKALYKYSSFPFPFFKLKMTAKLTRQSRSADLVHGYSVVRESNNSNSTDYRSLFTVNVYTAGALWRMTLNYDGNALSQHAPLRANMTSSTKPETRNILHCRQRRPEPRPQVVCRKFHTVCTCSLRYASGQTYRHPHRNTSHLYTEGEVA